MNNKVNILLLFGGKSTENEISIKSARNVYNYIDKKKYNISLVYIDKNGDWYNIEDIYDLDNRIKVEDYVSIFKYIDLTFPLIHGKNGEDGSIQGFLETIGAKYIGSNILSSSVCLDKSFTKTILQSENIPVVESTLYRRGYTNFKDVCDIVENQLGYPVFIKPCTQGSSVGVNKAENISELNDYLDIALKYDNKVLIEKAIVGRELEIGIIGNDKHIQSVIGEIILDEEFYTFENKYEKDTILKIPTELSLADTKKLENIAIKAFNILECNDLARIDFLMDKQGNIFINEINTIPGFTSVSMFPLLFKETGYSQRKLLDELIKYNL